MSQIRKEVMRRLPDFRQGSSESPGEGFQNIDQLSPEHNEEIQTPDFWNEIIPVRYSREEHETVQAYVDGELAPVTRVEKDSTDIFWSYPKYLYVRGDVEGRRKSIARLRSSLADVALIEKLKFSSDFFIWLLYQYSENNWFEFGRLQRIFDISLQGERDGFGGSLEVSESKDALNSPLVISGLLSGKSVTEIELLIQMENEYVRVKLDSEKLFIKASGGSVETKSDLQRMKTSVEFLTKFCELYQTWQNLSGNERYPPDSFFEDLYRTAHEQGVEIHGISNEMLSRYRKLRQGSE